MFEKVVRYSAWPGKNSPAWTVFQGRYINLTFQDGSISEHGVNGTTNEEVIQLLIDRIESLNKIMPSEYNNAAVSNLQTALYMLGQRTKNRERRGVEGTMTP